MRVRAAPAPTTWAARVRELFQADADWSAAYNHTLANGKWDHMMDQTHIGYTYWQQPEVNAMPAVADVQVPEAADMGVWPSALAFDSHSTIPRHTIDIFNRGRAPLDFTATASAPWIVLDRTKGTVPQDQQISISIDYTKRLGGDTAEGFITVTSARNDPAIVKVTSVLPHRMIPRDFFGFIEADGHVSMEAAHFTRETAAGGARWEQIPDLGRTLSAMTILPSTAPSVRPPQNAPSLEYRMFLFDPHQVRVNTIIAPTLNFVPGRGLRFAVAFDDQAPQIIDALAQNSLHDWEESVRDSARTIVSKHALSGPGVHVLKYWMVDPGVVLEKIVVDLGGLKPSYLGPPESVRRSGTSIIRRSHTSAAAGPRNAAN